MFFPVSSKGVGASPGFGLHSVSCRYTRASTHCACVTAHAQVLCLSWAPQTQMMICVYDTGCRTISLREHRASSLSSIKPHGRCRPRVLAVLYGMPGHPGTHTLRVRDRACATTMCALSGRHQRARRPAFRRIDAAPSRSANIRHPQTNCVKRAFILESAAQLQCSVVRFPGSGR